MKKERKVGNDADRQEKCVCDMIIMLGGFRAEGARFASRARAYPQTLVQGNGW